MNKVSSIQGVSELVGRYTSKTIFFLVFRMSMCFIIYLVLMLTSLNFYMECGISYLFLVNIKT